VPPIDVQTKRANLPGFLRKGNKLQRKQNQTAEQIAQTLHRQGNGKTAPGYDDREKLDQTPLAMTAQGINDA
jgi:hypothetical protein